MELDREERAIEAVLGRAHYRRAWAQNPGGPDAPAVVVGIP
eukprot:CAMPEP_0180526716 /NCGR_PEP_ID=MMETSP1036_2-20121128/59840_1 /TAXON_ID=632150 /ORGANISM="Azadinium spinosum, Strain 3D9" /LENGTH=40 /DNA_ID= /DNA_START= /DNA_END= /DNA_ORIENTATION=